MSSRNKLTLCILEIKLKTSHDQINAFNDFLRFIYSRVTKLERNSWQLNIFDQFD